MPREQRLSNGQVPGYGKQHYDDLAITDAWRSRISTEGVGYRHRDESGSSLQLSMVWCPVTKRDMSGRSAKGSSEIKALMDTERVHRHSPAWVSAPLAAPVPPPSASQRSLSSRASNRSGTSIDTAQLNSEGSRLQAPHPACTRIRAAPSEGVCLLLTGCCTRAGSWADLLARGEPGAGEEASRTRRAAPGDRDAERDG